MASDYYKTGDRVFVKIDGKEVPGVIVEADTMRYKYSVYLEQYNQITVKANWNDLRKDDRKW